MSKLIDYRALERRLMDELEKLDQMRNDDELKKEIEFEEKLKALMEEYDLSPRQTIQILVPDNTVQTQTNAKTGQRTRKVKIYNNPETGESIETKGGNHKKLKEWKEMYGADKVNSWLQ